MEFTINLTTPVLFGTDASLKTGERLKQLGVTKALFVFDKGIEKAGIPDKIIRNVEDAGIDAVVYNGVQVDPPKTTLEEGAELGRKEGVDGVVAIGGGSSMDTAKGINLLLTNPSPVDQYMVMSGARPRPGKVLVLIPTTSGTGSEVTSVAVITDTEINRKRGLGGDVVRATLAIVDPLLAAGMPPSITADTGLDALVHAIEAVTATRANPMTDILGERAITLVMENLPKAVKNGSDIEARTNMSFAAMIAGFAFNDSMTHLAHSVGHTLGSMYHVPHGNACGIILPEMVEYISETVPDAVRRVGLAMGLKTDDSVPAAEAGRIIRDALIDFSTLVGQKTLKTLGVREEELPALAEASAQDGTAFFCPRKAEKDDILVMLKSAYQR
jgi:alcohol dehydrogenase